MWGAWFAHCRGFAPLFDPLFCGNIYFPQELANCSIVPDHSSRGPCLQWGWCLTCRCAHCQSQTGPEKVLYARVSPSAPYIQCMSLQPVQAVSAITGSWIFWLLHKFWKDEKTKDKILLVANSTSNNKLDKKKSDLWNVRKIRKRRFSHSSADKKKS